MAQLVKNPHAMWETWVPSLGWEDPWEKTKGDCSHSGGRTCFCDQKPFKQLFKSGDSNVSVPDRIDISVSAVHMERNRRLQCRDLFLSRGMVSAHLSLDPMLQPCFLALGQHNQEPRSS